VCARGWRRVAQGTGPSLTANAGDGRRLAPDFPSSIRFPCTSAPALIDRLHVPQPYTDPSAGSSPPPASTSAFPSPFPFPLPLPLCFLRPSLPPCATAAAPPPRARPACARPPALLFSLSRRDGPSLASAPATLPRDPHHLAARISLLTSRASFALDSTRLDLPRLTSPRPATRLYVLCRPPPDRCGRPPITPPSSRSSLPRPFDAPATTQACLDAPQ
jgi:hypothetical protein